MSKWHGDGCGLYRRNRGEAEEVDQAADLLCNQHGRADAGWTSSFRAFTGLAATLGTVFAGENLWA